MFAGGRHLASALRTGLLVPYLDAVAAAEQAKATCLRGEGRSDAANGAANDKVLDGVAVGTRHRRDVLSEQSATFVNVCSVTAR